MSAPEIPSGWDTSLRLPSPRTIDHLATLARIQSRYTTKLGEELLVGVYDFAVNRLAGGLPPYASCQPTLYRSMSQLSGNETGGGLQYNAYHGDVWLAIRVPLYEVGRPDGHGNASLTPLYPMEGEEVMQISDAVDGIAHACTVRWLPVTLDLTSIKGDTLQRRIIQPAHQNWQ